MPPQRAAATPAWARIERTGTTSAPPSAAHGMRDLWRVRGGHPCSMSRQSSSDTGDRRHVLSTTVTDALVIFDPLGRTHVRFVLLDAGGDFGLTLRFLLPPDSLGLPAEAALNIRIPRRIELRRKLPVEPRRPLTLPIDILVPGIACAVQRHNISRPFHSRDVRIGRTGFLRPREPRGDGHEQGRGSPCRPAPIAAALRTPVGSVGARNGGGRAISFRCRHLSSTAL